MLVFCLWIWLIGRSLSAPLAAPLFETGNTTSYESAWQNAPTERGTSTLLISCLTTLFFAAWTAYHPNVPSANSGWGATATRLQWIVMTAFAPEIVLWSAWTQYRDARRLLYEMNKVLRARQEQASPENFPGQQRWAPNGVLKSTPSHTWPLDRGLGGQGSKCLVAGAHQKAEKQNAELWTIEQAFFAVAGGIGVDSSSFSSHKSVCFTGRGLLLLARCGLLPTIPLKQIQDKSKADALSRVLVCVQGAWFMAQTIARWIQDLPVSLLELHAFVHVVCAICMYALWWSKGYSTSRQDS